MAFVNLGDLAVAGILHGIVLLKTEKLQQKAVQILGSGTDNDLFRGDSHIPEFFQMLCDGLTEREDAAAGRIGQQLLLVMSQKLSGDFSPDGEGEMLGSGLVTGKIGEVAGVSGGKLNIFRGKNRLPGRGHGLYICDKEALFGNGINITFRDQLGIGIFHGDGAYAQIFCKTAF